MKESDCRRGHRDERGGVGGVGCGGDIREIKRIEKKRIMLGRHRRGVHARRTPLLSASAVAACRFQFSDAISHPLPSPNPLKSTRCVPPPPSQMVQYVRSLRIDQREKAMEDMEKQRIRFTKKACACEGHTLVFYLGGGGGDGSQTETSRSKSITFHSPLACATATRRQSTRARTTRIVSGDQQRRRRRAEGERIRRERCLGKAKRESCGKKPEGPCLRKKKSPPPPHPHQRLHVLRQKHAPSPCAPFFFVDLQCSE